MIKKLLLSLCLLLTASAIHSQESTIWESKAEFTPDWNHYEIIDASVFQQHQGFTTINLYYDDLFYNGEFDATIQLSDGNWKGIEIFSFYNDLTGSRSGKLSVPLTPEQTAAVNSTGVIIQGRNYYLTKVTVDFSERPRYIHDMIWGENSGFEAPQSGWDTWGAHFDAIQAVDYGNGYNSDTAMKLVNTSEGEIWENHFRYIFPETLAPGKYKLEFNVKSDIDTGGSLLVVLSNSTNYFGVKFHNVTAGTDWSKIEAEFEISEGEEADALVIQFGKEKGSFYIDNVRFGPYLESKPDMNLLWSGNGQDSGYAGLINPDEISAGDIIRLTFSQDAKLSTDIINIIPVALFHAKIHQNGIADPAISDITDGILEIGVTNEMLYNLKSEGIVFELPAYSPQLVKIERVESGFNPKGVIAYGHHDNNTCKARNIYTYPTDSDDKIAVMFSRKPTSVTLSTGTDYSVKIGDQSTALSRVRADGSTVMVFYMTPEIINAIRTTGHFRIESDADFKYVYTNPTMDVPGVDDTHDLIWDKAMKISDWVTYLKFSAGVFSHVSAGDKIYFHVDDATTDKGYGIIAIMYGSNWEQFYYYNFFQEELNPDGLCRVEITLDNEQAERLKAEGIVIAGDGFTLSHVSIESAMKPDDNLFYGFHQFYGAWHEKYSQPFTMPADGINAGDVIRIHFASETGNLNHLTPYTDNYGTVSGTVNWIMDYGYNKCYQDIGITNQFIESCNDNILLHGSYMINKVEILRDRFDPTDMLAYGTTEHSNTNITVKIPHNAIALEITFDDEKINGSKELTFYPTPGDDSNNIIFEEESFISSEGLSTVTVDLTPELIKMINEVSYGQLSLKCTLPFRYMKAVIDPTVSIDNINADKSAEVEYYNLQGVRVNEPAAGGIYIRRQGSTTEKILIK